MTPPQPPDGLSATDMAPAVLIANMMGSRDGTEVPPSARAIGFRSSAAKRRNSEKKRSMPANTADVVFVGTQAEDEEDDGPPHSPAMYQPPRLGWWP